MSESIPAVLARWAAGLRYDDVDSDAIHHAKRLLLDTVGCALGGFEDEDASNVLGIVQECAGDGPCTVVGSGAKVDPVSAGLANALMVRALDFNDIYWRQDPCHPSDLIPAAMAACERADLDARDLLLGVVLGHEIMMRLAEAARPGIRERGWHHATLTALVAPLVAGRLLGLEAERIQHAIGLGAARQATFGAVTAGELSTAKNLVDPLATQSGVLAALMAEKGATGPADVIEGKEGLVHCLGPEWDLDVLTDGLGASWRIGDCGMKAFPTEALTHTPISATIELVTKNDLAPEQIETVHVRTLARAADILADPPKYDPRSRETADHSLPYVLAAAVTDRAVTLEHFTPERMADPILRAQIGKVKVTADPDVEAVFPERQRAIVTITTKDGRDVTEQLDQPKGDPQNPLTEHEIEAKFDALADPVMSEIARKRLKESVWMLHDFGSARNFMSLCVKDRE